MYGWIDVWMRVSSSNAANTCSLLWVVLLGVQTWMGPYTLLTLYEATTNRWASLFDVCVCVRWIWAPRGSIWWELTSAPFSTVKIRKSMAFLFRKANWLSKDRRASWWDEIASHQISNPREIKTQTRSNVILSSFDRFFLNPACLLLPNRLFGVQEKDWMDRWRNLICPPGRWWKRRRLFFFSVCVLPFASDYLDLDLTKTT